MSHLKLFYNIFSETAVFYIKGAKQKQDGKAKDLLVTGLGLRWDVVVVVNCCLNPVNKLEQRKH